MKYTLLLLGVFGCGGAPFTADYFGASTIARDDAGLELESGSLPDLSTAVGPDTGTAASPETSVEASVTLETGVVSPEASAPETSVAICTPFPPGTIAAVSCVDGASPQV